MNDASLHEQIEYESLTSSQLLSSKPQEISNKKQITKFVSS